MPSLSTEDTTFTRDVLGRFLKLSLFGAFASLLLVVNSTRGVAFAKGEAGVGAPPIQLLDHAVAPAALQPGLPENPFARPRFIVVNAVRMHVIDETGPDWWGSDEIVVDFSPTERRARR